MTPESAPHLPSGASLRTGQGYCMAESRRVRCSLSLELRPVKRDSGKNIRAWPRRGRDCRSVKGRCLSLTGCLGHRLPVILRDGLIVRAGESCRRLLACVLHGVCHCAAPVGVDGGWCAARAASFAPHLRVASARRASLRTGRRGLCPSVLAFTVSCHGTSKPSSWQIQGERRPCSKQAGLVMTMPLTGLC